MIYPIVAYGHPILRKEGSELDFNSPDTPTLIADMYATMDHCNGVGLAAPQINKSLKLFVIDSTKSNSEEDGRKSKDEVGVRMAFVNPVIIEEFGKSIAIEEGCLSIPGVYGEVIRPESIKIEFTDENGEKKTEIFSGFTARIIQHEYDHIMGKLFVEKLSPLKRQLIKKKLDNIRVGKITPKYKMIFV